MAAAAPPGPIAAALIADSGIASGAVGVTVAQAFELEQRFREVRAGHMQPPVPGLQSVVLPLPAATANAIIEGEAPPIPPGQPILESVHLPANNRPFVNPARARYFELRDAAHPPLTPAEAAELQLLQIQAANQADMLYGTVHMHATALVAGIAGPLTAAGVATQFAAHLLQPAMRLPGAGAGHITVTEPTAIPPIAPGGPTAIPGWIRSHTFHNRDYGTCLVDRYGATTAPQQTAFRARVIATAQALLMNAIPGMAPNDVTNCLDLLYGGIFLLSSHLNDEIVRFLRQLGRGGWRNIRLGAQCRVQVLHENADFNHSIEKVIVSSRLFRAAVTLAESTTAGALNPTVQALLMDIWTQLSERDMGQSGYRLVSVNSLEITVVRMQAHVVGAWIATPIALESKKAILNIRNSDDNCAKYAFSLGVMDLEKRRPREYQNQSTWTPDKIVGNWDGIAMPMDPCDWDKFETRNPSYGVFIYAPVFDPKKIYLKTVDVLRVPRNQKTATRYVYLMLLEKTLEGDDGPETRQHYVTISSLGRLLNSKYNHKGLRCPYCTTIITNMAAFETHVRDCSDVCESRCRIPLPGTTMQFERMQNKIVNPIFGTADFECRMEKVVDEVTGEIRQVHQPISVAIHFNNQLQDSVDPVQAHLNTPTFMFASADPQEVIDTFLRQLQIYSHRSVKYCKALRDIVRLRGVAGQLQPTVPLDRQKICQHCDECLMDEAPGFVRTYLLKIAANKKKRKSTADDQAEEAPTEEDGPSSEPEWSDDEDGDGDRDEAIRLLMELNAAPPAVADTRPVAVPSFNIYTGVFEGWVHKHCYDFIALKQRAPKIPCYLHNATGYDMKLIISRLGTSTVPDLDVEKAFMIARTSERVNRLDICGVTLVDSMAHLNASLDKLVSQMKNSGAPLEDACRSIREGVIQRYGSTAPWRMLTKKGEFPYSWLDSYARMAETELPPPAAFKSDLDGRDITPERYAYAQEVWSAFGCATFRDYHDVYLLVDVLALADVMLNYRKFCLEHYKLDPTYYASCPALAFDAMLRLTKVKLELLSDMDMILLFERSLLGGISLASQPFTCVDNTELRRARGEDPTPLPTDQWIAYLDENNEYGFAMCKHLPTGEFQWVPLDQIASFSIEGQISETPNERGFLLEVDLEFPPETHEYFNDFPPAPERLKVKTSLLSTWQQEGIAAYRSTSSRKLVPHLMPHKNYVLHGSLLRLYMRLGVKVTKIHRILTFKQGCLIRPFVELNTQLRKEASARGDECGSDFAKLFTNSVYGKFLESVREHADWRMVSVAETLDPARAKHFRRLFATNRLAQMQVQQSVAMLRYTKKEVLLNRPIYLGSGVLSHAKQSIYGFYYDVLKENFPTTKLIYTDTDSIICVITTTDLFRDCQLLEERMCGKRPSAPGEGVFDWSSLDPAVHPNYHSKHNAKELGKFKFETGSKVIRRVTALRSKMYSLEEVWDPKTQTWIARKCVAKGVPRGCHAGLDFDGCLFDGKEEEVRFTRIGGRNMQLETQRLHKRGLARPLFNDKRFIEQHVDSEGNKSWTSFALGHRSLDGEMGMDDLNLE